MADIADLKDRARTLLRSFKGDDYAYGGGAVKRVGEYAAEFGRTALVFANHSAWIKPAVDEVKASLALHGVALAGDRIAPGSKPNSPQEDVYRMATYILHFKPDCVVAIGGGSTIDAAKAAIVIACLGHDEPELEPYFGMGLVSAAIARTGAKLLPLIAVQTASGSGAHLTKYSNVTDPVAGQKKLIIDDVITPRRAVFDYAATTSASVDLTLDGAFDGLAHCLEVFYGAKPDQYGITRAIAEVGIELIVDSVPKVIENPADEEVREALGLATDLGGYAIMVGGTNGGHLTSFSLVDVMSHGRACAVMDPYYTVFFAPAIEPRLRIVGDIYRRHGYIAADLGVLHGRELGNAVAEGMVALSKKIGFPTKLSDEPAFTRGHIEKALKAAKNLQLDSKLKNMPVPLDASTVDEYMRPVLEAAAVGDFSLIKNM